MRSAPTRRWRVLRPVLRGLLAAVLLGTSAAPAGATDARGVLGAVRERARFATDGASAGLATVQGAGARGVAVSPNGVFVLVNKQQTDGRWMITLDGGSGYLSGNVLTDAGEAVFLWCDVVDAWGDENDIENSGLIFDCQSTDDGATWFPVSSGVRVPSTFFLP